ncbi:DUF1761 domain-containing protein [Pelagibacterium montanilacus]|uniref:DUF1761 domain-containing protein n=1 Tax=Pelagibacterium montanilacus TaxID=2185280 RepID=UPI000F8C8F70|nr:DUF1761 domain-containing protein [Pelagibacterium montanilacus]
MDGFGINWLAVVLAMVASMALGAAWYMGLSRQWVAATGKSQGQIMAGSGGPVVPLLWGAACQLVMAGFLAFLTPAVFGETSVYAAVRLGVMLWAGFIMTSMVLNHRYQGHTWSLAVIDGGYLLGVMIVQGVVIGVLG